MRRSLRARRSSLSAAERSAAANSIARFIATSRWLLAGKAVGLYVAVGYEVATAGLFELARRRRCPIYLPRITNYRHRCMQFALASPAPMVLNRHGIPEPAMGKTIAARALSVVFMPVLGFDARGARLGSGAGYYDRLFWFRRQRLHWQRPVLVGIAFSCQELAHIELHQHDVPLDALVSEDGVRYFRCEGV
jgi:5-formyltetrahydrofolate cyclo-ligase